MSLAQWHERLLVEALEWRKQHPEFRFALRAQDRDGRLERGYWFHGSDDGYLFFAPFAPGDKKNKTKTVGFSVDFEDGEPTTSKLEIVFREPDNPEHIPLYERMVAQMGPFRQIARDRRYQRIYSGLGPVEAFRNFLTNDYPRLLTILRDGGALDTFLVGEERFKAMLDRVQRQREQGAIAHRDAEGELCLIGTWRSVGPSDQQRVKKVISNKGGWAAWWSFPIRDEFQNRLQRPFDLYLNSGGDHLAYRMRVEKFVTSRGNEGIVSPWPEATDEHMVGKTREPGGKTCKTWVYVTDFELLDPPLTTADFEPADGRPRSGLLNQSGFGYVYRNTEGKTINAMRETPLNLILFGPPGTGKTHWLRETMKEYTDSASSTDRETWLLDLVGRFGWRPVIAAALAKLGPSRVSALRDHEWVQAKIKERGRSATEVQQTLWGFLQEHTPESVLTVRARVRRPPFIFSKREDSTWEILDGWQKDDPTAAELYGLLMAGPNTNMRPVRRYRTVTFHPSFSYEDFVRGIRPITTAEEGETQFRMVDGVFKQICDEARANPRQRYALFIDEINRANIAKVFGELISLIESDKRATFDASGNVTGGMTVQLPGGSGDEKVDPEFGVPSNLDIYGTMNTADRSIALMDVALRRRFQFQEMEPDYSTLKVMDGIDLSRLLARINDRLECLLDRERRIGHAYLMKVESLQELQDAFRTSVIPLLQEYFFDDLSRVGQALATLGPQFIRQEQLVRGTLFPGVHIDAGSGERYRYRVTDPASWTKESFVGLYGAEAAPAEEV